MPNKKEHLENPLLASDVCHYLTEHPNFLIENPSLFNTLTPPDRSQSDEVLDFQNLMIEKIRTNLKELQNHQGSLINTTRNNLTTQVQIHEAVLNLFDASDLDQLCHITTLDWADSLHIDIIRICFEEGHDIKSPKMKDITLLIKGAVETYLGKDDIVQLRGNVNVAVEIFGPATSLIKAEALIKIPATEYNPVGLLAFGSRDAEMFYPGQGTELLRFLGTAFHKCLVQWLIQRV